MRLLLVVALSACFERGSKEATPEEVPEAAPPELTHVAQAAVQGLRARDLVGEPDNAATIQIALETEPIHLNPILAADRVAVRITLGDVYEALLVLPRPGAEVEPALATRYSRSPDGKRWQFWLRSGVQFHNGKVLSPADVLASFNLACKAPGPLRSEFDDLVNVKTAPDNSMVFQFSEHRPGRAQAFASVPIVSARSFAFVRPEELATAAASMKPNGTGALRFDSRKNGTIVLKRNARYWGTPARAAVVRYTVFPDRERLMAELRAGRVDVVYALSIDRALRDSGKLPEVELFRESLPAYTAAVFNAGNAQLTAAHRRVLAQSFDRVTFIRELFSGFARQAIGPYPLGSTKNDPSVIKQVFSLAQSRADLSGGALKPLAPLRMLVPEKSRNMRRLADIWVEDLRGVADIRIVAKPFAELLEAVRTGDFDITFLSFTTSEDVDLFSLFHSSQVGSTNLARLRDDTIDTLLDNLRRSQPGEESTLIYRTLHSRLRQQAPFAFLTSDLRLGIVRKSVGGVGDSVERWGARYLWRRE
ncbi:MAG: ABC transporter substrate-binding protein [Kofleriaceae bacterium]|nr:ABC transporter substrate-binding protein [Kofleriaceae bacterium]